MTISNESGSKQSDVAGMQCGRCDGTPNRATGRIGAIIRFFGLPLPKNILRVAVTAAFVYFVNRSVSGSDVARLFREVRGAPMSAAVLLGVFSFLLQMLRWRLILKSNALPHTCSISLKTMLRGSLLAFITPGRVGELFRALHLDRERRLTTITAVAEERMFAVIITVVAGVTCLALQSLFYHISPFVPVVVSSALFCAVMIIAAVVVRRGVPFMPERVSGVFAADGPVSTYLRHIRTLPHIQLSLLSVGAHVLLLVQTALLFQMFGSGGFVLELLVAGQAFSFMLLLPFFIANIGLREYAFTLFLGRSAIPHLVPSQLPGIALGVGTSILIINIILPAVLGLTWMFTDKKSVSGHLSPSTGAEPVVAPENLENHDNAS